MSRLHRKTDRHYTWADYQQFPAGQHWELIDGVAYAMAPAPSFSHQDLSIELASQLRAQLRGKPCRALAAPIDVRFVNDDRTDTVVQPDLLVVCDAGKLTPRGVVGAPDWIIEILSPATASHDQISKRALYERQGVREYWTVHPVDRVCTLHLRQADGRYGIAQVIELTGITAATAVPGLQIDWDLWDAPELPEWSV